MVANQDHQVSATAPSRLSSSESTGDPRRRSSRENIKMYFLDACIFLLGQMKENGDEEKEEFDDVLREALCLGN